MTKHAAPEMATAPAPGILARLRLETRSEHDAIERALDFLDPGLTLAAYRRRLERFYGFYAPVEDRLGALGAFAGPGSGPERKLPLLVADLLALGGVAPERLPLCQVLPELAGPAEALGCLYVLEGATLGGQVIARHLRATLGIGPENGGRFFLGRGEETGPRWRAFSAELAAFEGDEHQRDAIVRAAIGTFRALRVWVHAQPTP